MSQLNCWLLTGKSASPLALCVMQSTQLIYAWSIQLRAQQRMNDTPVIRLERYSCSDRAEHARRGNVADIVNRTTVTSAAGCTALENHQMRTMPTPIPPKRKRCLCRDRRSLRPKRLFSCLIAVDSTDLSRPELYLPEVTGSIDNLIDFIKGCLQSPNWNEGMIDIYTPTGIINRPTVKVVRVRPTCPQTTNNNLG